MNFNGPADSAGGTDKTGLKPYVEAAGSFLLGRRQVNRVGYGAMQLAGDNVFGPPRDRDEALGVLRLAVESGINHIDTAQYYGPGTVNELIREALYPYPDDLVIVSKVGARRDAGGTVLRYDEPDQLRIGVEDNLRTLGVDRLPAVNLRLMDGASPGRRFDSQLAALMSVREEGLIEGIGLSNIQIEHLQRALNQTEIVCVQNLFNLADQHSLELLFECCSRDIAFVPFAPLGRSWDVQHSILASTMLAEFSARLGFAAALIALPWLLDLAPNVLLIPGTRTRQHLAENIRASVTRIDDAVRMELAQRFS